MGSTSAPMDRATSGVEGLDDILGGGFPRNRLYLLQGDPGAGKTTVALQFLLEGARAGEACLYVTLSETREELLSVAAAHGWSLEGVTVYEMAIGEAQADMQEEENTLYVPAEVELGERMRGLLAEVDRVRPSRIVLDSCTELRLLAQTPLRFRRQLLALKEDLSRRNCTILLLENPVATGGDPLLQSLVHGVIVMEQLSPLYGASRRRLRVSKLRQVAFRAGYHDFTIRTGGLAVFPRLVAAEQTEDYSTEMASSGLDALDALLGGGLDRGTSTLLMGPAGTGKSVIAAQFAVAAAKRGEHAAMFIFDEGLGTLMKRAGALGMPLRELVHSKKLHVRQIDPAEMSPGELVNEIRCCVEKLGSRMIVIDSLNGYMQSMPEEHFLTVQLHELLSFLRRQGVMAVLTLAQHGLVHSSVAPIDISYLADTVVLTRYFEVAGRVHKAISVVKKRAGAHEDTIRELTMGRGGIQVGPPLARFRGVLSGFPMVDGGTEPSPA